MLEGEWTGKVRPLGPARPVDGHRLASLCLALFVIAALTLDGALAGRNGLRYQSPPGSVAAVINFLHSLIVVAPLAAIWFPYQLDGDFMPPRVVRSIGWAGLLVLTAGAAAVVVELVVR